MRRVKMRCAKPSDTWDGLKTNSFTFPTRRSRISVQRSNAARNRSQNGARWRTTMSGELPAGWEDHLPKFEDAKPVATRVSSGEVLNALAPVLPMLIGGSADLGVSNNPDIKPSHSFEAGEYDGRILHFGVREHAMGSTLTGISLHGG